MNRLQNRIFEYISLGSFVASLFLGFACGPLITYQRHPGFPGSGASAPLTLLCITVGAR